HWEDGGRTDTANLVALCGPHHRLHHRGGLGIAGNADEPEGMVFTDPRGRRLTGAGRPAPPGQLRITGTWLIRAASDSTPAGCTSTRPRPSPEGGGGV
ncbi:MAG: HNH endonuclease, partial [Actinomycetota bacterium]|nr:HNH endonuclease [Actinomycetota bacterium]